MNGVTPKLKVIPHSCGPPSVIQSLLQLSSFPSGFMFDCCCPGDLGKWQGMLGQQKFSIAVTLCKRDEVCPQKSSGTCGSPAPTEIEPRNVLIMSWKESQQAIGISLGNQNMKLVGLIFHSKAAKKWALKGFLGTLWRTFSLLPYRFHCHILWVCRRSVHLRMLHKTIVSSMLQSVPSICAVKLPKACYFLKETV